MRRQIWPQNLVFLTMPQLASVMIRVFPSLEHSTDCVRKPADNFRTFVWRLLPLMNKTQPREAEVWIGICLVFNSRCQRVSVRAVLYCLWRSGISATKKSAHCLRVAGHTCGLSKRGKDTESDTGRGMEETLECCFKECCRRLHSGTLCTYIAWNILFRI